MSVSAAADRPTELKLLGDTCNKAGGNQWKCFPVRQPTKSGAQPEKR